MFSAIENNLLSSPPVRSAYRPIGGHDLDQNSNSKRQRWPAAVIFIRQPSSLLSGERTKTANSSWRSLVSRRTVQRTLCTSHPVSLRLIGVVTFSNLIYARETLSPDARLSSTPSVFHWDCRAKIAASRFHTGKSERLRRIHESNCRRSATLDVTKVSQPLRSVKLHGTRMRAEQRRRRS